MGNRIYKNVANQKWPIVMVDKTDFATPETGITVTGIICKDGGASATLSNTVSELTNGQYVVTLSQDETNADLLQFRFHDGGASCAQQCDTVHTEVLKSIISNILSTLDDNVANKLSSILNDTKSIIVDISDVSSAIDSAIHSTLDAIHSTLDGPVTSDLSNIESIVGNLGGDSNKITSILEDTKSLIADVSDVKSQLTNELSEIDSSIDEVLSTIDGPVVSTLDRNQNDLDSILADSDELQTDWKNGGRLDLLLDAIKAKTDIIVTGVKKNVALNNFTFVMIDSGTKQAKTGLTVTCQIAKDGNVLFVNSTNAVAEMSAGAYKIDFIQAEMNADDIMLKFTAPGAWTRFITIRTES